MKKNKLIGLIISVLCLQLIGFAVFIGCKDNKKPIVENSKKDKTQITSSYNVIFDRKGKTIKKVNVSKYSDIAKVFDEVEEKYKKDKDYLGMYVKNTKLSKDYFGDSNTDNDTILKDLYGAISPAEKTKLKDKIKIFLKYDDPNYQYSFTLDGGVSLERDKKNSTNYLKLVEEIPSHINNLPVKKIGDEMYTGRRFKKSIKMPDSITSIGKGAFAGAITENIKLSENIISVDQYAFSGAWKRQTYFGGVTGKELKTYSGWEIKKVDEGVMPYSLVFSNSINIVKEHAFANNSYIRAIIFKSDKAEQISGIYNMENLQDVRLPGDIKSMGYISGFPKGIRNFKMPYRIGKFIEENNTNGYSIDTRNRGFMNNVGDSGEANHFSITIEKQSLLRSGFNQNDSLKQVSIKAGVNEIFNINGANIERVTIDNGISIIHNCFNNSVKLQNVTIPQGMQIVSSSFRNCINLKQVTLANRSNLFNREYKYDKEILFDKSGRFYKEDSREFRPSGDSFSNNINLEKINIGENVHFIEGFNNCNFIKKLIFTEGAKNIRGFNNCENLEFVSFPQSTVIIEGFSNNKISNLKLDHLNQTETLSGFSDTNISQLDTRKMSNLASIGGFSYNNIEEVFLHAQIKTMWGFLNGVNITNISIPEGIENIKHSFNHLYKVSNFVFPNSVKSIENTLNFSYNLKKLTIGSGLKKISTSLFKTDNLADIKIIKNDTLKYHDGVFYNDVDKILYRANFLEDIPKSLTKSMNGSIYGIKSNQASIAYPKLSTVEDYHSIYGLNNYKHTLNNYKNSRVAKQVNNATTNFLINKPDHYILSVFSTELKGGESVKSIDLSNIGNFRHCITDRFKNLKKILINKEYSSKSDKILAKDSIIEEIEIEKGSTTFSTNIFRECINIKKIIIHEGIKSIFDYSFNGISTVKVITIPSTVIKMGKAVFQGWDNTQLIKLNFKKGDLPKCTNSADGGCWFTEEYIAKNENNIPEDERIPWHGNTGVMIEYLIK